MAKPKDIPQDIIDNVIAAIGDDKDLLKKCALVSSSFLHPSRKQLFTEIHISSYRPCDGIHQLLVQNALIRSFVRTITLDLTIISPYSEGEKSTPLFDVLQLPFCCLERFSIFAGRNAFSYEPYNWNDFSSEMKDALSNIIHLPTLKTLSLYCVQMPIAFFHRIVHLTTLELSYLSPYDFGNKNSSSLTRAASKKVRPTASDAVIDRCVWCFGWEDWEDRSCATESIFIPFMCNLCFLEIHIDLGAAGWEDFAVLASLMGLLPISLTSPATLEHLEFNIWVRAASHDFDNNFYESFSKTWRNLDSITTHPTGSRLQRVDINIKAGFSRKFRVYGTERKEIDENKVLEDAFEALPLLHKKGIVFVKAAMAGDYEYIEYSPPSPFLGDWCGGYRDHSEFE